MHTLCDHCMSPPLSCRVTWLALGQSYDCPSASEVTLKHMGNYIIWMRKNSTTTNQSPTKPCVYSMAQTVLYLKLQQCSAFIFAWKYRHWWWWKPRDPFYKHGLILIPISKSNYRQVSNISRTKSQHLKDSHIVLRLSLPNPLKPDVKSRMKMQ